MSKPTDFTQAATDPKVRAELMERVLIDPGNYEFHADGVRQDRVMKALLTRITELEAEKAELREALRPFRVVIDRMTRTYGPNHNMHGETMVPYADLRHAAKLWERKDG